MGIKKTLPKPTPKAPAPTTKKSAVKKQAAPRTKPVEEIKKLVYTAKNFELAKQRVKELGPPPQPQNLPGAERSAASVAGQTWVFIGSDAPKKKDFCRFFEDGSVTYDGSPGVWEQHGAAIVFELNGRYVDYRGVIEGDTASGSANNIVDFKWTWSAWKIS
jgi:hypothetical protein